MFARAGRRHPAEGSDRTVFLQIKGGEESIIRRRQQKERGNNRWAKPIPTEIKGTASSVEPTAC